ncbi:hypothetical protein KJ966_27040 [bacterium]|nr:hypothetical protein [bacterium]
MGNEIEIKDLDIRSTSFLPTEIKDIGGMTEIYSLEDEFAKTKKNRNLLLYFSILLFFVVVVGSAFLFSIYIQDMNKTVEINISEFEDLRLKEVIDSARSHENNLDLLLIKLEILKIDQQKKILEVKQKYYKRELDTLDLELSGKETGRRLAQIKVAEKREIAGVERTFQSQINEKTQEIDKIKEEIAKKEMAKKDAEETEKKSTSVSNVDRLNALKMEELKKNNDSGVVSLREYYVNYITYLKNLYNPVFKSQKIDQILQSKGNTQTKEDVRGFHPIYQSEGIINQGEYEAVQSKADESKHLMSRVLMIPYENSVSPTLKKINAITNSVESDYENMLNRFAAVLNYKNKVIDQYHSAFDYTLSDKPESGYVINADNTNNIHVHLNKIFQNPINSTALIFREDNKYIGKIEITRVDRDNVIRAKLVNLAQNQTIKPFDKILLEIN